MRRIVIRRFCDWAFVLGRILTGIKTQHLRNTREYHVVSGWIVTGDEKTVRIAEEIEIDAAIGVV
ncbi:MAG: hypothetical protein RMM53_12115 [Bacteroidia bacterium]|nr:hypothetical protein [Bacteroidia bacterium]MDW8334951.1 hypothetical protein [Bacteroidia bacterium]